MPSGGSIIGRTVAACVDARCCVAGPCDDWLVRRGRDAHAYFLMGGQRWLDE